MGEYKDKLKEPSGTDMAVSAACTRSGAFTLLLSIALFSLVPYWLQERTESFVGRYLSLRLNLLTAIDQLEDDPYWLRYKALHESAEFMPMEQLVNVVVEMSKSSNQSHPEPISAPKTEISPTGPPKLSPPTQLRASTKIYILQEVAGFLTSLNDSDLLTTSRKASGLFDYSIYRWVVKRDRFIERNKLLDNPSIIILRGTPEANIPDRYVPEWPKSEILKHLTLRDVRELARYELPKIEDTIKLEGSGGKEIELSPGMLPRNLYMASVFAEILILFVIMYFKAFAGEATLSAAFPPIGTLFGAFARSSLSVSVFFIGLWSPFVASLTVAIASGKLSLLLLSAFVGIAVFSVHRVLQSNSFFTPMVSTWKALMNPKKVTDNMDDYANNPDNKRI